ncbi:head-tail connector protein [Kurthia massiliensis]|uniref:head-tail connector protein n=1 Tax=Kurthia massiliensis TaxID=1033739 RepID=UPI0002EF452F|nr:head-tail connector protein [Kurthia massiliensis]
MISILELVEVKNYLRVDISEDDEILQKMITSSQSYIENFLNKKYAEFTIIPPEFDMAQLSLIAYWYENRTIQSEKATLLEFGNMFRAVISPYRVKRLGGGL